MFVPFKIKTGAAAVALALVSASFTANAVLERAGPVTGNTAIGFFPTWYQDRTGITLEFCAPEDAELEGAWCLLGNAEVPTPPEVFPGTFFDEHFYFAAGAGMDTRSGGRALLVLAEEAAFASGAAQAGQQIVFSRIRVRLASAPVTGTYRFIHPYGEESIFANAGERIFFTEDIGIDCAPGKYDCSTTSRLGPFLLPSATPGGPEMPALTADQPTPDTNPANFGGTFTPTPHPGNGKAYIADPSRIGPVTGSPVGTFVDSTGQVRDHNIFRIEGPALSGLGVDPNTGAVVDWVETTGFSLMGRLFNGQIPGRVGVQRSSYARNAVDGIKVDVMADGQPTTSSRMPTQAPAAKIAPALSFFNAPCIITTDALGVTHYSPPAGAGVVETQMLSIDTQHWGQTRPATIPESVCLNHSNARDLNGNTIPVYSPHRVTDEVTISVANYDQVAKTLAVTASSSDQVAPPTLRLSYPTYAGGDLTAGSIIVPAVEVPPSSVKVVSNANLGANGANTRQVKTSDANPTLPAPAAPSNVVAALGAPRSLTVTWNDNSSDETSFQVLRATALAGPYTQVALLGANAGSFVDNNGGAGLAANTTYFYRVVALRGTAPNAVPSAIAQSAGLLTPSLPAAATGLATTVVQGTPLRVDLAWNDAATNEDSYRVFRATGAGAFASLSAVLGPNTTSFSDATVVSGTSYRYRIDASNWAGTVSTTSATLTPVTIVLAAVSNLTATVSTTPRLNWVDNSTGESNYGAIRTVVTVNADGSVGLSAPTPISSTILANATTFLEPTAQGTNATRRYDVAALSGLTVGPLASVYALTSALPTPARPTLTRSLSAGQARITVGWPALTAASVGGYEIQRCTGGTCTNFVKLSGTAVNTTGTVDGRATTSFIDTTVARGTTYRYRLRSVGGAGTGLVGGTFSGILNRTTQ